MLLELATNLPFINSAKMKKEVGQLKLVNSKLNEMYDLFAHFTRNSWIYETLKLYEFESLMTKEEKQIFYIDPKTYSWAEATHLYGYGVEKYMFKEDKVLPDGKSLLLLNKNKFRSFDDF